jgi:hypothetical protein
MDMAAGNEELYTKAMQLAQTFDENFVELGEMLLAMNERDPRRYRDFIKDRGREGRKMRYLRDIADTVRDLKIPKRALIEVGWTKLMELRKFLTLHNWKEAIEFAKTHTVKQVQGYVKSGGTEANAKKQLSEYFNPVDHDFVVNTLIELCGAKRGRRGGIENKEAALIEMAKLAREAVRLMKLAECKTKR